MNTKNHWEKLLLVLVLALSLFLTFRVQQEALSDRYRQDDDYRQYFWLERVRDPELFPKDAQIEARGAGLFEVDLFGVRLLVQPISWLFSLIYGVGSQFMQLNTFNNLLPFGLMLIAVYYLFRIGQFYVDATSGFFLALLFAVVSLSATPNISLTPGLQRSFSFVLLIVFLYYLIIESRLGLIISLAAQSVIYFPMFVVSSATGMLSFIKLDLGNRVFHLELKKLWPIALGIGLGALFILPAFLITTSANSPYPTDLPVWQNPYFSAGGRIPIFWNDPSGFPLFILQGYGGLVTPDAVNDLIPLFLILGTMTATLSLRKLLIPRKVALLLIASLLAWLLVWLVALFTNDFLLRYPFKYTSAAIPLVLIIIIALNMAPFANSLYHALQSGNGRLALILVVTGTFIIVLPLANVAYAKAQSVLWAIGGVLYFFGLHRQVLHRVTGGEAGKVDPANPLRLQLITMVGLLTIILVGLLPNMSMKPLLVETEAAEVIDMVSELPKDTLLAGDPILMSNIPPFAKRSVLFSSEIIEVGDEKIRNFYDAYYAEDLRKVMQFCGKYGVNYLIVNKDQYTPDFLDDGIFFYAPYNDYIKDIVAERSQFVLPSIDSNYRLFENDTWFLMPCDSSAIAAPTLEMPESKTLSSAPNP